MCSTIPVPLRSWEGAAEPSHDLRGTGIVEHIVEPCDQLSHPFDRMADALIGRRGIAGEALDYERECGDAEFRLGPAHLFTGAASARMRSISIWRVRWRASSSSVC